MNRTPGLWFSYPETDYVPAQIWADGRQIAEVYGETREIRAANARLMAAAPEMLEALEAIVKAGAAGFSLATLKHDGYFTRAEAAIRKAGIEK